MQGFFCADVVGVIVDEIVEVVDVYGRKSRFFPQNDCTGDYTQRQTDHSNIRENNKRVDYDYKVGDKVLIHKDGILRKAEFIWKKEPWTITTIHTNGTIRITKSERINIRRVTPFSEELLTKLGTIK